MRKKVFSILFALVLVLSFSLIPAMPAMAATTYYVDVTGSDTTGDGSQEDPWATIQHAVDTVSAGSTINVVAGEYDEQVVIKKALTLQGAGDTTIIKPSSGDKLTYHVQHSELGNYYTGVVVVETDGADVTVKDLKIDAANITNLTSTYYFTGITYFDTGGVIDNIMVANVLRGDPATPQCDYVDGIHVKAQTKTLSIEVKYCTVQNSGGNNIILKEGEAPAALTANIHHNTIIGRGTQDDWLQNGIQFHAGVTGTINYNAISNLQWAPSDGWTSAGILFYPGSSGEANNNTITDVDVGICAAGASGTFQGNIITRGKVGLSAELYTDATVSFTGNTVTNSSVSGGLANLWETNLTADVTFSNNTITSDGTGTSPKGIGVQYDCDEGAEGGTLHTGISFNVIISGNTISGWDDGIRVGLLSDVVTITKNNSIYSNTSYGVYNDQATLVDATYNWWGTAVDSEIAAMVYGDVNYANWLETAPISVGMTGQGEAATPPAVTTSAASAVAFILATLNGNLDTVGSSEGGPEVSFVYGTTSVVEPTQEAYGGYTAETTPGQQSSTGAFTANLTGLTLGETYYFRARAKSSDMGTLYYYGSELSFTTAVITTTAATNTSGVTTVTLNGSLDIGDAGTTTVSFMYGTAESCDTAIASSEGSLSADGTFHVDLTGLTAGQLYYFKAKGTIGSDTDLGDMLEFTTADRIGLTVSPTYIDFGTIIAGHSSSSHAVTVTNSGTAAEVFTTSLSNDTDSFYANNLAISETTVALWGVGVNIASGSTATPGLVLSIPIGGTAGEKTATLVFWAQLS